MGTDRKDPATTCACDVMTPDPVTIELDVDLDSAIRVMNRAQVRRLPVTENGKLIGILSSPDVAKAIREQFDQFIGLEGAYTKH